MPHINDGWDTTKSGCFGFGFSSPGDYSFPEKPCCPPNKPLAFDCPDAGCQAGTDLCQEEHVEKSYSRTSLRETETVKAECSFTEELERLINSFSEESNSNTPDFILAEYMRNALDSFNIAVQAREKWYGRKTF